MTTQDDRSDRRNIASTALAIILFLLLTAGAFWVYQARGDSGASTQRYLCVDTKSGHLKLSTDAGCENGSTTLVIGDLRGERGLVGATGAPGLPGTQGARGATGPAGAKGTNGAKGATGATGATGPAGPVGPTGAQGLQGLQGERGAQGDRGATGATGPTGAPGPSGAAGTSGAAGAAFQIIEDYATSTELMAAYPVGLPGWAAIVGQNLWVWVVSESIWEDMGPFRGSAGADGKDGTSVTILGSFATESELTTAHPTGNPGDGYMVDGDLYVWSEEAGAWVNVGQIRGPQGETGLTGPTGPQGIQGETGPQGPQGEAGPVGPAGPQGEVGPAGPAGPQGEPGPAGPAGPAGGTGDFGSFSDIQTQTAAELGIAYPMLFRVTDTSNGVSIVSDSRITFAHTGVYNIAFSAQLQTTNSNAKLINVWLRDNNGDVAWTDTEITMAGSGQRTVAAWNFFVTVTDPATQYFQLVWAPESTNISIVAQPARTENPGVWPASPGIPSIILTVNRVGLAG